MLSTFENGQQLLDCARSAWQGTKRSRPANQLTRELGMQLMQGATRHGRARDMIQAAGFDKVTAQAFVTKSGVFAPTAKRPANQLTRELGMQLMQGATGYDDARDMIKAAGFDKVTAQAFVTKSGVFARAAKRRPANELTRELGMQLMQGATGRHARDMIQAAGFTQRTAQAFVNQMKA
jgi:flagellar biosynthesis regulator FlaF